MTWDIFGKIGYIGSKFRISVDEDRTFEVYYNWLHFYTITNKQEIKTGQIRFLSDDSSVGLKGPTACNWLTHMILERNSHL